MNRGIARRSVFEDKACVRYFLSRLARVVRSGHLEVHAFVFMPTHYHLLLRSIAGCLSDAMRLIQQPYVRWFNRRNKRDGPLFRGRFHSRRVESLRYRKILVRYIDQNPVVARMVPLAEAYPHGSARHFAADSLPPWLESSWVTSEAGALTGEAQLSNSPYHRAFGAPLTENETGLVESRLAHPSQEPDPLDDLVGSAPASIARWMRRKAALADGTEPGLPCACPQQVLARVAGAESQRPEWRFPRGQNSVLAWEVLRVALLRDLSGLGWSEIGVRTSTGESSTRRRYRIHGELIESEEDYRETLGVVAHECLGE